MKKDLIVLIFGTILVSGCSSITSVNGTASSTLAPAIQKHNITHRHLTTAEKLHNIARNLHKPPVPSDFGLN